MHVGNCLVRGFALRLGPGLGVADSNYQHHHHLRRRFLQETISTADCNTIRVEPFPVRLDMYYFYLLEYNDTSVLNLYGVDQTIGAAIIEVLNECDGQGMPMYAVQLSPNDHQLAGGGKCYLREGIPVSTCIFMIVLTFLLTSFLCNLYQMACVPRTIMALFAELSEGKPPFFLNKTSAMQKRLRT